MKKLFPLIIVLFLLSSCAEDIKFNNPALQGLKDNVFWRAQTYKATLSAAGDFTIEGSMGYEKVILQTASSSKQTYTLGQNNISKASYSNTLPTQLEEFTTGTNIGNGQIVITEYNTETSTVSGTFKFTAINTDEENTEKTDVKFSEGVFYKVPVSIIPNYTTY